MNFPEYFRKHNGAIKLTNHEHYDHYWKHNGVRLIKRILFDPIVEEY